MNLEVFDIIIFITGAILGLIIGLTVKKGQQNTTNNNEQNTTETTQFEAERKQAAIDDFFTETNERIISTEKAIHELKKEFAAGASTLATADIINKTQPTKAEDTNTENNAITSAEPPKDYSTNASGTLSENFGLQAKGEPQQDTKPQ